MNETKNLKKLTAEEFRQPYYESCDGTYDSKYDRFQTDFCDAGLCESKY